MRLLITLLLVALLVGFAAMVIETYTYHQQAGQEIQKLEQEMQEIWRGIHRLQQTLNSIEQELDKWSVYEATAYAPLDPQAVEGMCYEGDPHITASGAPVILGETVAAGPDMPFGTEVYIRGLGRRVVQDRGGRIGDKQLDVVVKTRAEAFAWGRRQILVREGG